MQNPADIDKVIEEKQKEYTAKGLTLQPFLVFVHADHFFDSFYVILDHMKYKLNNPVQAVDFLFKLFFAVDIHYPTFCELIWRFIQISGFEINEAGQKLSTQVLLLLAECRL